MILVTASNKNTISKYIPDYNSRYIPKYIIERVPTYLTYLDKLVKENILNTSSRMISNDLNLGEVQVRKDLNIISGKGKPKIGYNVIELKEDILKLVRIKDKTKIIIIGAGNIGNALANYKGFDESGFEVIGLFDYNKNIVGTKYCHGNVLDINELESFCVNNDVDIGVIATPSLVAQEICDRLVSNNVLGILNFTNTKLEINENVKIRNVDIASILTMLTLELNNN